VERDGTAELTGREGGVFSDRTAAGCVGPDAVVRTGCSGTIASCLSSRVALTTAVSNTNRGWALNLSASSAWVNSANNCWICSGVSEPLSAASWARSSAEASMSADHSCEEVTDTTNRLRRYSTTSAQ